MHQSGGAIIVALRRLGCQQLQSFASSRGVDLGWYGDLSEPISPQALQQQCVGYSLIVPYIVRVGLPVFDASAWYQAADSTFNEAFACGCDAFISGESAEQNWHDAQGGYHFYACGHFATENIAVHDWGAPCAAI